MATMLLMAFWFRATPTLRGYGLYSSVSMTIVAMYGGLAAWTITHPNPLNGLIERITIFGFLQWLFVIGLRMYEGELM